MTELLRGNNVKRAQSMVAARLGTSPMVYSQSSMNATDPLAEQAALEQSNPVSTLFVDIGGVLLTDGWDHHARERAATLFSLDWIEMESRHRLNFATYEEGKISLEEYLDRTIFFTTRSFTADAFREFMFSQSKPYPLMIALIRDLKARYALKIIVVSNEARELNLFRIHHFKLNEFVDGFVSSCFVHLRKPDRDIFLLAVDIAQTPLDQIVYIENTAMFVQIAQGLGIRSILHQDYQSTVTQLAALGLESGMA